MKYRLVAIDMDGTLLNSEKKISEKTVMAVRKAVEKGLIITICTGRPIKGIAPYIETLGLDIPFMAYNGALIVMGKSGEIIFKQCLEPDDARAVFSWGKKFGTTIVAWTTEGLIDTLHASAFNTDLEVYRQYSHAVPVLIRDEEALIRTGITKILFADSSDRIAVFEKTLRESGDLKVDFYTSQPEYLEFMDKRASKAFAMARMGERFGIKREEMVAIGDGFNDVSMIEYAGLGVVMENAPEELKTKADYVTLSNDDDGVAYVLEKIMLNEI